MSSVLFFCELENKGSHFRDQVIYSAYSLNVKMRPSVGREDEELRTRGHRQVEASLYCDLFPTWSSGLSPLPHIGPASRALPSIGGPGWVNPLLLGLSQDSILSTWWRKLVTSRQLGSKERGRGRTSIPISPSRALRRPPETHPPTSPTF